MRKRSRNNELLMAVGKRIAQIKGKLSAAKFANSLSNIVDKSTVWTYVQGFSFPAPEVLVEMSNRYNISIDYILKGEESIYAKDVVEKTSLSLFREIRDRHLEDEYIRYGKYLLKGEINEGGQQSITLSEVNKKPHRFKKTG